MKQSKKRSMIEAITNVVIGFLAAYFANITVLPAFNYHVTLSEGAYIALIFTIISLIRAYVVRRLFNYYD